MRVYTYHAQVCAVDGASYVVANEDRLYAFGSYAAASPGQGNDGDEPDPSIPNPTIGRFPLAIGRLAHVAGDEHNMIGLTHPTTEGEELFYTWDEPLRLQEDGNVDPLEPSLFALD